MGWFIFGIIVGSILIKMADYRQAEKGLLMVLIDKRLRWVHPLLYFQLVFGQPAKKTEDDDLNAVLKDIKGL